MKSELAAPTRLVLLGSTGSIGKQTLDVVRALPDQFRVIGLAAGENLALLKRQIDEFKPALVCAHNPGALKGGDYQVATLEEMAACPDADIVLIATAGSSGLDPLLSAIQAGKKIALANKEPLVMAGEIVLKEMKKSAGWILPVDSEHSAIWQCMAGETEKPARLILTASGGPFLHLEREALDNVTPEQALRHPSWKMGRKVTIDSATLLNKGLEVIEAHWLFDMPFERIDILVHPQSIVHSLAEMADGSIKAQISPPDMRLPIQYALSYPNRFFNPTLPRLDWKALKYLEFEEPDWERFPCLRLAIEAGKKGGTYPSVLCGADETAVDLFLSGKIRFTQIAPSIERVLDRHAGKEHPALEEIIAADLWARRETERAAVGAN
jgi:1-deoxy-D-xylulose-5-phosphate reductoisomerase